MQPYVSENISVLLNPANSVTVCLLILFYYFKIDIQVFDILYSVIQFTLIDFS